MSTSTLPSLPAIAQQDRRPAPAQIDEQRAAKLLSEAMLLEASPDRESHEIRQGVNMWSLPPGAITGAIAEARAVGKATTGGNTLAGHFVRNLIVRMSEADAIQRHATWVESDEGVRNSAVAVCDDTANSGHLLDENLEDAELALPYSQLVLASYKFSSKLIKISMELAEDSPLFFRTLPYLLGRRLARAAAPYFTSGTGTGQPSGIVTGASDSGITAAGLTPTADELLALKHSVDSEYWMSPDAGFMMAPSKWLAVKQSLDATSQGFISSAARAGGYDLFDGMPVILNKSMPTATGTRSVIFGDISRYVIRVDRQISLRILVERFTELGQIGAVSILGLGGGLADTAAVKYLDLP